MSGSLPGIGVTWLGPLVPSGRLPARPCFDRPPRPPPGGSCPRGKLRRCAPPLAAWGHGAHPRRHRPAARKAGSCAPLRSPAFRLPGISSARSATSGGARWPNRSPGRAHTPRAAWLGWHPGVRPSGLVWPACPVLAGVPAPWPNSARRPGPEDWILPPAPRWGGVVATSLYRSALVAPGSPAFVRSFTPAARPLPRLRFPAPGGKDAPAEDAQASMPAQEPPWPASCLVSPRASCPRLVAGPGVRTAPHRSRALRRPALRPPGSASSTSRACAGQLRPLASLPTHSSWVALCPLRASRLRGRGFARYAATPPPSGTPLPVRGRGPHRCLRSLDASPPSLRFGRLRWPAPCGPSRPWQDGQGSLPARRQAPGT